MCIRDSVEETGAPEGTTILVRDLFYNTPARLKFMKKDSAETAAAAGLMQHLALSHPDISFKFLKDGQEALHTPGDGRLDSAVYAALGRDFARTLLPVKGGGDGVTVSGFITQPLQGRGSRSMQTFFVNGRFIKSQLLTAALEEGYRNQIMKGRFPGCVLAVTLPVTAVDVNVHPAKTQVKFAQEKAVFDAVYHTVLDCLEETSGTVPPPAKPAGEASNPRGDFFRSMDAKTFREQSSAPPPKRAEARPVWNVEQRGPRLSDIAPPMGKEPLRAPFPPLRQDAPPSVIKSPAQARPEPPAPSEPRPAVPAIPQKTAELPGQEALTPPVPAPWRVAGEVLRTYIVCESEEGCVYLIDKHAAHERINFDRLKAGLEPPMRQTLLTPAAVDLGREEAALLLENLPLLEDFGFSCEDFGGGSVLVREVPADLDAADVTATLEEIAGKLRQGRTPAERREGLLHTMACKAAIKGGWKSGPEELRALAAKVQSGEVKYCPHGRPVAVKITKYELEKMFKRA